MHIAKLHHPRAPALWAPRFARAVHLQPKHGPLASSGETEVQVQADAIKLSKLPATDVVFRLSASSAIVELIRCNPAGVLTQAVAEEHALVSQLAARLQAGSVLLAGLVLTATQRDTCIAKLGLMQAVAVLAAAARYVAAVRRGGGGPAGPAIQSLSAARHSPEPQRRQDLGQAQGQGQGCSGGISQEVRWLGQHHRLTVRWIRQQPAGVDDADARSKTEEVLPPSVLCECRWSSGHAAAVAAEGTRRAGVPEVDVATGVCGQGGRSSDGSAATDLPERLTRASGAPVAPPTLGDPGLCVDTAQPKSPPPTTTTTTAEDLGMPTGYVRPPPGVWTTLRLEQLPSPFAHWLRLSAMRRTLEALAAAAAVARDGPGLPTEAGQPVVTLEHSALCSSCSWAERVSSALVAFGRVASAAAAGLALLGALFFWRTGAHSFPAPVVQCSAPAADSCMSTVLSTATRASPRAVMAAGESGRHWSTSIRAPTTRGTNYGA